MTMHGSQSLAQGGERRGVDRIVIPRRPTIPGPSSTTIAPDAPWPSRSTRGATTVQLQSPRLNQVLRHSGGLLGG